MIRQLVARLANLPGGTPNAAAAAVLTADPFDLIQHMEEVWRAAQLPIAPGAAAVGRTNLLALGNQFTPVVPAGGSVAWDHFGYSYVLENTRAVQILRRVVRAYRSGESLWIPQVATQQWLDATEALLFSAPYPFSAWLSTSSVRQEPEAVRRNAYWRLLGLDLAFGGDDNRPPVYDRADASNSGFVRLFEELLYELWKAMSNVRNVAGENQADDDRIFDLTDELSDMLRSRRQGALLAREELAAATVLGWVELTLSTNTPVVLDLRAQASAAADRLQVIGQRVGMAAHSKAASFFAMAQELSKFLRFIESGAVSGPGVSWLLYLQAPPAGAVGAPIGNDTRRVVTEWAAATGKNLKVGPRPIPVQVSAPASAPANRRLVAG
jgi:hypothetical protein